MNSLERLATYGRGEPVDRLPCVPIMGNGAARVVGVRVASIRGDGRLLAQAHVAAWRRFGYDGIRVFTDLYTIAEAMGAAVVTPPDETAYLGRPAVGELSEIVSLRPADPRRDGVLPAHLDAARRVVDAAGGEVPVTAAVTGPFTTASFLVGTERLLRLVAREPQTVHRLLDLALDSALAYAEALLDAGATPSLTDPMASASVIGPRHSRVFAFPYLKPLVDAVHGRGRAVTLHICGRSEPIWEAMAETGADCLSLDEEADLAKAARRVGHRVRLMGNVPAAAVMLLGTPADVRAAVRRCVAQAQSAPRGHVVASGCSLPTETPAENIDAMLAAVREIGWPVRDAALN